MNMRDVFAKYLVKEKSFYQYISASLFGSLLAMVSPFVVGEIVNQLAQGSPNMGGVGAGCITVVGLGLAGAALSYAAQMSYVRLQAKAGFELNADTIAHVQKLPQRFFQHFDPSYYSQQINHDANDLLIFIIGTVAGMMANLVTLIVVAGVLITLNVTLALVCIGLGAASGCLYTAFRHELYKRSYDAQEQFSRFFACLEDQLAKASFIRTHVLFDRFRDVLNASFDALMRALAANQQATAGFALGNDAVSSAAQGLLLFTGVVEIATGHLEVGYLFTALSYFSSLNSSVRFFLDWGKGYQDARVNLSRLKAIWDLKEEKNGSAGLPAISSIVYTGLTFQYSDAGDTIIGPMNGRFERGRVYGIAGDNGSGKSTFLKVISGIYSEGVCGSVTFDGMEIEHVDRYALRSALMGMTEQEPPIQADTIRANLMLLAGENRESEMRDYVDRLGLHQMVEDAPQGMETMLDERHQNLSGGEKQKIAIIRQLLKDPEVMMFDEPTSALDANSKKEFIRLIKEKSQDHLILIVTHDAEMLAACDEVVRI